MNATSRVASAGNGMGAVIALAVPLVMLSEGFSPDPFRDLIGKGQPWTYCFGETANVEFRRYTRSECTVLLERSLLKHATPIVKCLPPGAPVTVKAAFSSFGYNVGDARACGSTAAKKARAGDYVGACNGLSAWIYSAGKVRRGLVIRRQRERELCLSGL